MRRRVLYFGVLLAIALFFGLGIQGSNADDGAITGRFKTVEIKVTQYVWELVSNADGRVICQVIVEHPTKPTNDEAIQICGDQIFPQEPTPTPVGATPSPTQTPAPGVTPTVEEEGPFDLAAFFRSVAWRLAATNQIDRTVRVPVPEMIVNLSIPPGQKGPPFFVTITAYEPVYGQRITGISGFLNGWEFTCTGPRCDVPISTAATMEFWATSSLGDESRHIEATLRVTRLENESILEIESIQPITLFQDTCASVWGTTGVKPEWAKLPATPEELNTMKPYQYLAGRLLAANLVDAKDCPGGGFLASGAPNTCGLERAANRVVQWQNQYDVTIWETGRSLGIPPILIKTLIEQESQFWPGNSIRALFEYGLGQLSPNGADVALRWDNDLFSTICNGLIYDCSLVYGRLQPWIQATLRGGMMRALDAECPTCPNGIDFERAYDSIPVFARTLRANCRQVKYIMDKAGSNASYEDMWKFTLLSYHSGYQCLAGALEFTTYNSQPTDWPHISAYLACGSGRTYVENFWKSLEAFPTYRLVTPASSQPVVLPTFAATPAPTRTPTPVIALSHIRVLVYIDKNNNNYPDSDERAEGVKVTATFTDGSVVQAATVNGEAVIDLRGRPIGTDVIVALPELFRSEKVRVTRDGEIPVVFRLEQPVVPPVLP